MKKLALTLAIGVLTFASCKKDNDDDCQTTAATLAMSYKTVSIKYKQTPSSSEIDYFATLDACEKDDVLTLNANGTYSYTDAGTACTPSGSYTGTWSVSGNTITVDGDNGTIQSFDCNTLVLYIENSFVAGDRLTTTLVKQ
jgi:hypothetical protein